MRFVAFARTARKEISHLGYNLWTKRNLETNPIALMLPLYRPSVDNEWKRVWLLFIIHILHKPAFSLSGKFRMWISRHVFPCLEPRGSLSSWSSSLINRWRKITWRTGRTSSICISYLTQQERLSSRLDARLLRSSNQPSRSSTSIRSSEIASSCCQFSMPSTTSPASSSIRLSTASSRR